MTTKWRNIICECGHAVMDHTYSLDFSGCDREECKCTRLLPEIVANALTAELARLQRAVSTAELINAEAQLKNDNESKSLSISNNLLRDLAAALKAGTK